MSSSFPGRSSCRLRDVLPEALGHELAAQFGVVARFHGNGAVEALPGVLHGALVGCRARKVEPVGPDQVPVAAFVHACQVVPLVVDDEGLRVEAPAEPVHEQRDDVRLRVAACEPQPALQMLEAQELHHAVPLVVDRPAEPQQRLHGRMGDICKHAAPGAGAHAPARPVSGTRAAGGGLVRRHGVADEAVGHGAGMRVVGQRDGLHGVEGGWPARAADAALDAQGGIEVGRDVDDHLPEPGLQDAVRRHVRGVLVARIGCEHCGEQPFERAVVAVGDFQKRPVDRGRRDGCMRRLNAFLVMPPVLSHAVCLLSACGPGRHACGACAWAAAKALPGSRACCHPNAPSAPAARSSARPRPSPRVGVGMRAPSMPSQATAPDRTALALPRRPADRASPAHSMPAPPRRAFSGVSTLSNRLSWPGPTLSARRPWRPPLTGAASCARSPSREKSAPLPA